jgi:phosphonate transport system substrate-binding protein
MRPKVTCIVEEAKMKLFGRSLCLSPPAIRLCAVLLTCLLSGTVLFNRQPPANAGPPSSGAAEYTFGAVPQFEQRKLHAIWKPIVDELALRTGLQFNLVSTLTVQEFHSAYTRGQFDFVYVNPYNIARLHGTQAYVPLVADKKPVRGIVVIRKDGEVKTVADLNGKTVAFPSPNAMGASLLVRSDFEQIHHIQVTPLYVKTHSSVYLHVAKGLAAAGGGVEKTLQEQAEAIRAELQVIYTTRSCPSHPVAAHPRVPPEIQERVRQALLAMGGTREGTEMLAKVPITELVPVTYDDYTVLQSWGLEKYWPADSEQN